MGTEDKVRQIDELIDDFDVAMLVTESLEGELRARPMAVAGHDKGNVLYFLARATDAKLDEMRRNPRVNVVMQSESQYLSISGTVRTEVDPVLPDDQWSAGARVWFPDGKDDPELTQIVVDPTFAECWDANGTERLEYLWEAGKALVTGSTPDQDELEGHVKVRR